MSNLVEVKIPTNANPFTVTVNGKPYSYPAGATVQVPYEVAEVINQISRGPNLPPSSGGGGSGGGTEILNEYGIIKQQHLPENFPYKEGEESIILPETTVEIIDSSASLPNLINLKVGQKYTVTWNGVEYKCEGQDYVGMGCAVGNFREMTEVDTGEPFFIIAVYPELFDEVGMGVSISALSKTTDGTRVALSISGKTETVTKIGKEYLPDGYPYAEPTVFLPETTPIFSEDMGGFVIMSGLDADMFIVGQSYTVNWNGTEYVSRATVQNDGSMKAIILGDMVGATQGVPTTGEPFVVMILDAAAQAENGIAAMVIPIDGSASVTLSITGETLTPVDAKFLPNATIFVDVYGTIGGTYEGYGEKPENISKQSHTNAEILALAKLGKNVIIRNYDSETGTAFKCYNLSEVDFNFARFTKVYFSFSAGIGSTIEVLINGKMSMQETKFA